MNKKKFHKSLARYKAVFLLFAFLLSFAAAIGAWLPQSGSSLSPDATYAAKSEKKKKKKKRANKYIKKEVDGGVYIIRNVGTPHEHKIFKKRRKGEKAPKLKKSKFNSKPKSNVLPGATINYTINVKNTGNVKASDVDVLIELDEKLGEPTDLKFKKCGKKYVVGEGEEFEISNIRIRKKGQCKISFNATVDPMYSYGTLLSNYMISPASEGGEEVGPISSEIYIGDTPAPAEEPVIEEVEEEELPAEEEEAESGYSDEPTTGYSDEPETAGYSDEPETAGYSDEESEEPEVVEEPEVDDVVLEEEDLQV